MLSSVVRPVRSIGGGILRGVNGGRLPLWSGRHLCQEVAQPFENFDKAFVTGPLTMLSEEEEMMRDTGTVFANRMCFLLKKSACRFRRNENPWQKYQDPDRNPMLNLNPLRTKVTF